jgi:Fe2+ or Zn2+ uptake regulation protein
LQELVDEDILMKTAGILDKVIYEKKKPLHGHIVCHKSTSVFDIDISHLMVEGKLIPENFNLTSINIIFD